MQFKPVQTWLAKKAAAYLSKELKADVGVKSLYLHPFRSLVLEGFYITDLQKDTLISTKKLSVKITDFSIFTLDGITLKNVDLENGKIYLKTYKDSTSNFQFILDKFISPDTTQTASSFKFALNDVTLHNIDFKYKNYLQKDTLMQGVNFDDIHVKHLSGNFKGIDINQHLFKAQINHLSLQEKSGFILNDLTADATVDTNQIVLKNLLLVTPKTKLTNYFTMKFKSFSDFNEVSSKVLMEGHFKNSKVNVKDIAFFVPDLADSKLSFTINGEVKGRVNSLKASNLTIKVGKATYLKGNFRIRGLPDIHNTFMELDFNEVYSNKTDVDYILEQATGNKSNQTPAIISKFGNINFSGQFTGLWNDFIAYGEFKTKLGLLKSDVNMKINKSGNSSYSGKLEAVDFNLGDLIDEPSLNRTSFKANLDGKGFNINTLSENLTAKVAYFDFNDYRYQNININGQINRQVFDGKLNINDDNILLDFNGKANLNPKLPQFNFEANVNCANLNKLHFTKDTIQLSANIKNNFSGNSLDNVQGNFMMKQIKITNTEKTFEMDSIYLLAQGIGADRTLALTSDIGDASIKGEYDLKTLPSAFKTIIKKYTPSYQTTIVTPKNQNFQFNIDLKNFDYISSLFIPKLKIPDRGAFNGKFDSQNNIANLNGYIKTLKYDGTTFNNLIIDENTSAKALEAVISLDKVEFSDGGLFVQNIIIQNTLKNDSLSFNVKLSDKNAVNQLDLYGLVKFGKDTLAQVSLLPSDVIIDNQIWKIKDQVRLKFDTSKTIIDNFELSHDQQLVAVNGAISASDADDLEIVVKNLDMISLSQLTKGFGVNLKGTMNGNANLSAILGTPNIQSDFTIDSLSYNKTKVGTLNIASTYNNQTDKVDVKASIFKNQLKTMDIKGEVDIKSETNNLNLDLLLERTELVIFEPFVSSFVSNLKGQVSSDLKVTGKFKNPQINGNLSLLNAGVKVNYLGTNYTINDGVSIINSIIDVKNLNIKDQLGNNAVVNGTVDMNNPSNPTMNLTIDANNFMALNTNARDNELYYGKAFSTGIFRFNGPTDALDIKIKAKTGAGTVFTIPLNGASTVGTNDFIVYVAKDSTQNKNEENFFKGLTMEFDLSVDENSQANILTEVGNLSGRGNAQLNLKITSLGDFEMKGDYIINEGQFDFTANNVINKTFDMSKGGTIRWTGDPSNAEINLNAVYATTAATAPLYSAAGRTISDDRKNERVSTQANLYLKGSLLNPDISFSLEFPNNSVIQTELQGYLNDKDNEAQQVINLIVRNSFSGSSSSGIGGLNDQTLLGSGIELGVSKLNTIISQSLNIKNLDFNVRSLNEFNVGLNLFKNRLKISTSFVNNQYSTNNLIGSNIFNSSLNDLTRDAELSYLINKSGTFVAKVFQRPVNKDVFNLSSDIYNNGIGLSYTKEYDSFGEFLKQTFGRNRDKKQEEKPLTSPPFNPVFPDEKQNSKKKED
ncbi:MAG: translocation/assembly module TamB domain-containing protein [Sphingobacteriales bacterium]|nr:translocation/assembly module TamB domain-containing protein [Sphingobacteriales bacterium]